MNELTSGTKINVLKQKSVNENKNIEKTNKIRND